jgi:hypothetical protein
MVLSNECGAWFSKYSKDRHKPTSCLRVRGLRRCYAPHKYIPLETMVRLLFLDFVLWVAAVVNRFKNYDIRQLLNLTHLCVTLTNALNR